MSWTESRSRDEWLAEVRRRGERLRRRRGLAVSCAGAVALVAPVLAFATLSSGGGVDRPLQVAATGAPSSGTAGAGAPAVGGGWSDAVPTSTALAGADPIPEVTAPSGPLYSTTTTAEVHRRVARVNGVPASDDPVVRAAPAPTVAADDTVRSSPVLPPPSSSTTVPAGDPPLAACPVAKVRVTVTVARSTYAAGEPVEWSSTLENQSSTTCLVSGRAFFHVENGAGTTVGSFPYTADYMRPVRAEPGKSITNTGRWDQRDCSGAACVQVPAGTYVVVAEWTEGGGYVGRGSFQIGG